ncbi:hypothetical protein [Thermomonospora amylolytica]|uniref:hypothetical protein n=1 Tax=Thermomonospora amylolytica TaxID=1411117 RepID=UPI000E6BFA7E|nr:hypothetical protein [Thermomonospora amylolytica]
MSTDSSEPSPGERIAAALRRSPVYVDRSLASALPPAKRSRLLARMRASPIPIFIVIVPLVKGGTWDDPDELATVVHDRLGRDGAYVTLDDFDGQLNARQWGGTEEQRRDTEYAVQVPFFLKEMKDATLADRLLKAVDLIIAGRGYAEYEKATAHLDRDRPSRRAEPVRPVRPDDGGPPVVPLTAAGVGVAAVAGLVVWRWRRGGRVRRAENPLLMPRTALAVARQANEDELREQAAREVVTFGELLDRTQVDTGEPRVHELMTRALDAYQAAGKVLDSARGVPDLAGVLVLVDQGRDALASAKSLADQGKEIPPGPLCFFNPLHGDAVTAIDWRPLGRRDRLRIRTCRECTKAVRDHRTPDVLVDRAGGRAVPYFEADPERSVWARTGYGQLRDDLIQRVLRGDLRR